MRLRVFEHLNHDKILVTGPHRSGTTIAATAIANDLQTHLLVLEERCVLPSSDLSLVDWWINDFKGQAVLQAPFAADSAQRWPNALVVFMHRDQADIADSHGGMRLESGERVAWGRVERTMLDRYNRVGGLVDAIYADWQEQKKRIPNYLELEYEDLSEHSLWVPKEQRVGWSVRQTQVAPGYPHGCFIK